MGLTTGAFNGLVTDINGDPLPGVVINAVHEPTGTRYTTVTRANGRYGIMNARVGGPYTVSAAMTGFKTQTKQDLDLRLGEDLTVDFQLQLDTVEEDL